MWRRPVATILTLIIAMILALPVRARQKNVGPSSAGPRPNPPIRMADRGDPYVACAALQGGATTATSTPAKPFTQEQVVSMVRDGFGDESGAKLIEQRGIDFAPSEDFYQTLKSAGASEAFLNALRAAQSPEPASAKKPINQVQVFALLAGGVPSHRVTMLVQERGIDFEPTDEYLKDVRLAGGDNELIGALKVAKVMRELTNLQLDITKRVEVLRHVARGAGFFRDKRYAEAETEYRAALRLDPEDADVHMALGAALANKGDLEGATGEEREALPLNANDGLAHYNLGVVLGKKGDRDEEIAEYRAALRLNPDNESAHVNLGVALGKKGDWDGEVSEEREALRLDPQNVHLHLLLGTALDEEGDRDGALKEYREALRLDPTNGDARRLASWCLAEGAMALSKKEDWAGALERYREALRMDPTNEPVRTLASASLTSHGSALEGKGDWDGAIRELREALQLNPGDGSAHTWLARALMNKGDWEGAIEECHKALRLDPNQDDPHEVLGTVLVNKGDWDGAIRGIPPSASPEPK